jgi:Helix-turn-helix domain
MAARGEAPFRFKWEQALRDSELTVGGEVKVSTVKAVAFCLATWADGDGSKVRPSQKTVAASLGLSAKQVARSMRRLRELGWITVAEESGGEGQVTQYRLTTPDAHVGGTPDIRTSTPDAHVGGPQTPTSSYQSIDQSTLTSPSMTIPTEGSGGQIKKEGREEKGEQEEGVSPTLLDQIAAANSLEEMSLLHQEHKVVSGGRRTQEVWSRAHTAAAKARRAELREAAEYADMFGID